MAIKELKEELSRERLLRQELEEQLRKERELNRELEEKITGFRANQYQAELNAYNQGFKEGVEQVTEIVKRL